MSVLAIRNVWKQYGAQVVLERINLTVPARELVTVDSTVPRSTATTSFGSQNAAIVTKLARLVPPAR